MVLLVSACVSASLMTVSIGSISHVLNVMVAASKLLYSAVIINLLLSL